MSYDLPWWLWLVLSPLLIVVGLGAIAAAAVVIIGGGMAIFEALFGGLLERYLDRSALRPERAALEKGHWPPLALLHAGSPSLAERWAWVIRFRREGEVTRIGVGAWQVGELVDGSKVVLHHRVDPKGRASRTITVGEGPHQLIESFALTWAPSALRAKVLAVGASEPAGSYRTAPSIDAAYARAAAMLGAEHMPPPPPPTALVDLEVLLAHVALPRLPAPSSRSTLAARYEAWLTRLDYQPRPPLSEFADLFPEHATAGDWVALTEVAPPADIESDPHAPDDEVDDTALYLADPTALTPRALRIVEVCINDVAPWVRKDYRDAGALLLERVLVPAVDRETGALAQATLKALTLPR